MRYKIDVLGLINKKLLQNFGIDKCFMVQMLANIFSLGYITKSKLIKFIQISYFIEDLLM